MHRFHTTAGRKQCRSTLAVLAFVSTGLLVSSCGIYTKSGERSPASLQADCQALVLQQLDDQAVLEKRLDTGVETLADLVTTLHTLRAEIQTILLRLAPAIQEDKPLPPDILEDLQRVYQANIRIFDHLEQLGLEQSCWLVVADTPGLKKTVALKGATLALAAGTAVYDTYRQVYALLNEHERIRRALNQGDSAYGTQAGQLQAISDKLLSFQSLRMMREHIDFFKENAVTIEELAAGDQHAAYLLSYITSTVTWKGMVSAGPMDILSKRLDVRGTQVADNLASIRNQSVGGVSEVFGNAVGSFASRKGKLYNQQAVHDSILSVLQPGDILLEKTPFRLTDTFIPGHWGHAAIWVGNPEELKSAAIWEHPAVPPYHDDLFSGRSVSEALRDGVQLNTLEHFMNIDDILVLRVNNLTKGQRNKVLIQSFQQLGKAYDFNFDVDSTDKIVCSELVYLAYNTIHFETEKVAGRFTISPDNIAAKVFDDTMEIIVFYHDGILIENDKEKLLNDLMRQAEQP